MNKKILIAGLLTLASVAGVVGTVGNAIKADAAGTKRIYFDPCEKSDSNAKFWAHVWGSSAENLEVKDTDGDGIYEVDINSANTKMLFVRCSPTSYEVGNFNKKWNQSGDLSIPTDGKNCWSWSGTWDGGKGSWSTYTPPVGYQAHVLKLVGTLPGAEWDPANENYALTDDNEDHIYEIEVELDPGEIKLKIARDNGWNNAFGHSTYSSITGISCVNDADDNIVFTSEGGKYKFTFDYNNKTLSVTHTSYAQLNSELASLLTTYYNNGTYIRNTTINIVKEKVDEDLVKIADYNPKTDTYESLFHAGSLHLKRTTYFKGGELWMSRGEEAEGIEYSYYGTNGSNMTSGSTKTPLVTPEKVGTSITGKTMEQHYTTLADISAASTTAVKWTKTGNVWECTEQDVIKMFLDFTAPCFLNLNDANIKNYFDLTSVEVEQKGTILELRLIAANDTGKLINNTAVLSVATITK